MENNSQRLMPDYSKIKTIDKPYRDFKKLISSDKFWERLAIKIKWNFYKYYFVKPPKWRVWMRSINWHQRALPVFASIGAPRSGTSVLSDYIMQHPCVVLPLAKELSTRQCRLKHVRSQFPTSRRMARARSKFGMSITGYCSPVLPALFWPSLAFTVNDQLKILVILRNPVDRALSHWRWDGFLLSKIKRDPLWRNFPDFAEVARIEQQAIREGGVGFTSASGIGVGYLQHGIYLPFLKVLHESFGFEPVKVINADDFFTDPVSVVKDVYRFLGLPSYEPIKVQVKNASPKTFIDPELRAELVKFFSPINRQLYEYLGRDFAWC